MNKEKPEEKGIVTGDNRTDEQKKELEIFTRRKQSDHLNAMVGVGIGLVFGIFRIKEFHILVPFIIVIGIVFSHFYGRFHRYYLIEMYCLRLSKGDTELNNITSYLDLFSNIEDSPSFKDWRNVAETKLFQFRYLPLWIHRCGNCTKVALCLTWGSLVVMWYYRSSIFSNELVNIIKCHKELVGGICILLLIIIAIIIIIFLCLHSKRRIKNKIKNSRNLGLILYFVLISFVFVIINIPIVFRSLAEIWTLLFCTGISISIILIERYRKDKSKKNQRISGLECFYYHNTLVR